MKKIFVLFFIFSFFPLFFKDFYIFCKMSEGERCTCSGRHSKHSCCKIIKIQKDISFISKNPGFNLDLNNFFIKEISRDNFNTIILNKIQNLNIHSPPIFLKNQNFLI